MKGACVREAGKHSDSNKNCETIKSVAKGPFYKQFSSIMSNDFRYQLFVAVSGNRDRKVQIGDDVLSSHEQYFNFATSLDENCLEFQIQKDLKYHVYMRQTCLAMKLNFFKGRGYETYKTTKSEEEHKDESKKFHRQEEVGGKTVRGRRRYRSSCYSCKQHFVFNIF